MPRLSDLRGRAVILPDGRKLGTVHDAVITRDDLECTHLFVSDVDENLVEGAVPLAIPWRWVRGVAEVAVLRWFPETPIPFERQ